MKPRFQVVAALVVALAGVGAGGCGSSGPPDPEGYVSILEARSYFEIIYGGHWKCEGHGVPDRTEFLINDELREVIEEAGHRRNLLPFEFVTCRLGIYGGNRSAREDGIGPGSVLTYGIP
jgi:hypothetical protein